MIGRKIELQRLWPRQIVGLTVLLGLEFPKGDAIIERFSLKSASMELIQAILITIMLKHIMGSIMDIVL